MAEPRTFPNDPNPPPVPPKAPVMEPQAPPSTSGGASPAPRAEEPQEPRALKASFDVVPDKDGTGRSVYMQTDDLETTRLGAVNVGNSDELLAALGEFDSTTRSWRVPEKTARELMAGDMPLPDYIPAKYRANKAMIARGLIYTDWLKGKADLEDAQGRGDIETLKMQVKEAPLFVWQGDIPKTVAKMWEDAKEGPGGFARRLAGETAGQAAFLTDTPMVAAAGLTAGAALVVSRGLAAPAVAAGLAKALEGGAGAIVFKRSMEIEAGNAAAEMLDKGFDEATVRKYAPLVGVINGAMEVVSFRLLAAPFKRVALRKVLGSETVKKAAASAYMSYVKELGGEIAQEEAQEAVNVIAETMAADADERPDLAPKGDEVLTRAMEVGIKTLLGTAGMKVPGLALEAGVQAADKKAQAGMTKKLEERAKAQTQTPDTEKAAPGSTPAPNPSPTVAQLNEILGQHEAGKLSDDELGAKVDKVVEDEVVAAEKRPAPATFEEKTQDVERKAAVQGLMRDLGEVQTLIKAHEQTRDRFLRNDMSTKLLDRKIDELIEQENAVKEGLTFYEAAGKEAMVTKNETLQMKPATLENVINLGFKEGRKEVLDVRRKQILDVAKKMDLTDTDLRSLLKDRNYGTMGDVEFRNFMEGFKNAEGERVPGFKEKVAAHVKRKVAVGDVRKVLKDKAIKGEQHIRALHELPAIGKMTTKQLYQYVDILGTYDEGSVALTPKRIKANEGSKVEGAKTAQQVVSKAAKRVNVSAAEMLKSRRGQFDMLRGDTELSESEPAYAFAVDEVQTEEALGEAAFQDFERQNFKLGAAALASRASIFSLRRLVPSMPEVMAYLEADPAQVYTGETVLPELTPEEHDYVDFLRGFFTSAREYLFKTGELESTRFADIYAPHTRRSVEEMLVGIKSAKDVRKALGEFFDSWFEFQKELGAADTGGPALGLRKFFKQTLFRTGEMTPSRNVIRATNSYAKQFFKKQALDRALPVVDGFVQALAAVDSDQSEDTQKAWKAVGTMVKTYLNNKKGINASMDAIAPRGGVVDGAIRFVSGWISLAYIAGNLTLELAAPVGETIATIPVTGTRGWALAQKRMLTAQGRKVAAKYEYFTGKGALDVLTEPGKDLSDRAGVLLYGLLQWGRTRTMKTILMAAMTDEEFESATISPERLAQIKVHAGRWIDVAGMKSVVGSTSAGAAFTKFRGWYFPILRTTLQDAAALGRTVTKLGDPKKRLTPQQTAELYRIVEVSLVGGALYAALGDPDDDDDSFAGQLQKRIISEMFSLAQVFRPTMILTLGPVAAFLTQLGKNIEMTLKLEEYKEGGTKDGQLKGPPALKKQLPLSAALRNITSDEEK